MPLTAAMTGVQRWFVLGPMSSAISSAKLHGFFGRPRHSSMMTRSMPLQNASSPAPVSTAQRTSSFRRNEFQTRLSSARMRGLKALLTSGRFRVIHATPFRSS